MAQPPVVRYRHIFGAIGLFVVLQGGVYADSGCRTGATALADAYVLANPLYLSMFGDLESYVIEHAEHFEAEGDAIRCARAISAGLMGDAIRLYDPDALRQRDELNARLGAMGVSPGPAEPTVSGQLYAMSAQLARLARVLPAAAEGDFEPFNTPETELEQMQLVAAQTLQLFLQDPSYRQIWAQLEPMFRELARMDHAFVLHAAGRLAER